MTHDLDDISVYACWTRLNETPEDIARMSMRFMKEFSTRIKTGPWEPLEGEWDGTEAGLVEVIKRNPVTDDDGEPIPGDGYSTTLNNDRGPLNTNFNVSAGEDQLFERIASPCFTQDFYRSEHASAGELWDASVHAAVMAFDPAFAVGQEMTILMMTRQDAWEIPFGYRVWINDWVGTVTSHAEGLTAERLGNGTLIKVPDTWPAQQVVDALTETFQANNLDEVPITW
mgnify:FL=1